MADDPYLRLIGKCKYFEQNYVQRKNHALFQWFDEEGLKLLQRYCKGAAKLDYQIEENGIKVQIITKELLILSDFDKDILELLRLPVTCKIKALKDGQMMIMLWFRGWIWEEKEKFESR